MSDDTLERSRDSLARSGSPDPPVWALTLAWTRSEPELIGEVAFVLPERSWVLGRDAPGSGRLRWTRPRPGRTERGGPLLSRYVSRDQLRLRVLGPDAIEVHNLGRTTLRINGTPVHSAQLRSGDVLEIDRELIVVADRRSQWLPAGPVGPFGTADEHGLVGESPAMHQVRRRLAELRDTTGPLLITGPSGSGKELAARAVHRSGPFVAVNVAALPPGVLTAELFGNVASYPNPGMPARSGLVGRAEGGTLLLDELGELPHDLQAPLLRLLDTGEVQRLGADRPTALPLRIVAATNRPTAALKHDIAARFPHRLELPGLDARPTDVPLLAHHLLRNRRAELPARFFAHEHPRLAPDLVTALLRHRWTTHTRELERLLLASAAHSDGSRLVRPPDLGAPAPLDPVPSATDEPDAAQIRAALVACDGVKERTWRQLGLRNRHQLRRLMLKHSIT